MAASRLSWLPIVLLVACNGGDDGTDGTDGTDDTAVDPTGLTLDWTIEVEEDDRGLMMSVWGAADDDVWIVGGQEDAGVALRGSAGSWTEQALPEGTPLLNWVQGAAADDVWVGGIDGTLLHWDGSAWEDFSVDVEEAFWGLGVVASDDILAVGGESRFGGDSAMAWHWDGTAWSEVTLPTEGADEANLFKVTHDGEAWWVVGTGGIALTGADPDALTVADTGDFTDNLVTVHADGGEVVAVGGVLAGAVFQPDGAGALPKTSDAFVGLSGVHVMADRGAALITGDRGYTATYDLETAALTEVFVPVQDLFHATWVSPGGTAYAVGGNFFSSPPYDGIVATTPLFE